MFTFLLTFTCIGATAGAACGFLAYEPTYTRRSTLRYNDIRERRIQSVIWGLIGSAGAIVLCLTVLSAAVNMGATL